MDRLTGRSKVFVCSTGYQRIVVRAFLIALLLVVSASALSAETLMMPPRDGLMGTSLVVWGISTFPNGTGYKIDFGDGVTQTGNVVDRSYIAFDHTYTSSGIFTATLDVGGQSGTVQISIFDPGQLTADNLRNEKINMAIEDGLRWLWTAQSNRTNFDTYPQTWWGNNPRSFTALVVLAYQNQGYRLPNNNNVPTGLYEKYAVQRGLNWVVNQLQKVTLTLKAGGSDPCAVYGPAPCTGLRQSFEPEGYATSIAIMALAGTGAPLRQITDTTNNVNGNFTSGKTLGEILQRTLDALAWGQNDINQPDYARGGWWYNFNVGATDGSTTGWNMVSLLDAAAGGATIPAFVKPEFANHTFVHGNESSGFFDYQAGTLPLPNATRAGVDLQAEFFAGNNGNAAASEKFISDRWNVTNAQAAAMGDYTGTCYTTSQNRGCAYAMFNIFKGLKLQGVTTLPGVNRPAGPGSHPANDWYADYQDWLTNQGAYNGQQNQVNANSQSGGNWNMQFSCCDFDTAADTAIAELILSPTALVLPSKVTLAPQTATNPVGSKHTVTATVFDANGNPMAGINVTFKVTSGPNTGTTNGSANASCSPASCQSDTNGQVSFTYSDTGGAGTDTIVASVGKLTSNSVTKIWRTETKITCCSGPPSSDYNDAVTVDATLTDANSGAPIAGKTITFKLGSGTGTETCSATTNAAGNASCSITPNEKAGSYTLTASFAGDAGDTPSSASKPFQITLEEDTLAFTAASATVLAQGQPATFSATLKEDGTTPIAGRTLVFTLGTGTAAQTCSGTTNSSGTGSCTMTVNQPLGPNTVTVTFTSDGFYQSNSATEPVLVFAFLAGGAGGSFVLGDLNAVVGTTQEFWGAQWAKDNSLSGGPAPDAFKGFADNTSTTPPSCGGTWTTRPGNSSKPPDTIPAFMGIIVSSSIGKSGPTISGDIKKIVVVQTNPGYAGNPGHAGTGKVLAVFCQ